MNPTAENIAAITTLIGVIGGIIIQIINTKSLKHEMKEVVHNTNSIKDELVLEVRNASLAKGKAQGKAEEKESSRQSRGES